MEGGREERAEGWRVPEDIHLLERDAEGSQGDAVGGSGRVLLRPVEHGVGQHAGGQQTQTAGHALHAGEAGLGRSGHHREPQVTVGKVLAGALGEQVSELGHGLARGHGDDAVHLKDSKADDRGTERMKRGKLRWQHTARVWFFCLFDVGCLEIMLHFWGTCSMWLCVCVCVCVV